jgi:hypothetical protein
MRGMGTVTSLDERRRTAQERRDAELSALSTMHPALRWVAGADESLAHRRTPMGRTVCGAPGPLAKARTEVPLCGRCYNLPPDAG